MVAIVSHYIYFDAHYSLCPSIAKSLRLSLWSPSCVLLSLLVTSIADHMWDFRLKSNFLWKEWTYLNLARKPIDYQCTSAAKEDIELPIWLWTYLLNSTDWEQENISRNCFHVYYWVSCFNTYPYTIQPWPHQPLVYFLWSIRRVANIFYTDVSKVYCQMLVSRRRLEQC